MITPHSNRAGYIILAIVHFWLYLVNAEPAYLVASIAYASLVRKA